MNPIMSEIQIPAEVVEATAEAMCAEDLEIGIPWAEAGHFLRDAYRNLARVAYPVIRAAILREVHDLMVERLAERNIVPYEWDPASFDASGSVCDGILFADEFYIEIEAHGSEASDGTE